MAKKESARGLLADEAIQPGEALLIGLLVLRGCSEELLAFFAGTDEGLGRDPHIVVDQDASTIAFHEFHEAALGMAVAIAAGVVSEEESRTLIECGVRELAEQGRAAKIINIGKEGDDGQER